MACRANMGPWVALALATGTSASAQGADLVEREVVLTGGPELPPIIYGTPDVAVTLVFDSGLRGELALVGADVRKHPYLPNAVLITPSKALVAKGAAPLRVPLADGVVSLTLSFRPNKSDRIVRVIRRWPDAGFPPALSELQAALRLGIGAVFGEDGCQVPEFPQVARVSNQLSVCEVDGFIYLQMRQVIPSCPATNARLIHGADEVDALLVEPPRGSAGSTVVIRSSDVTAEEYELELLSPDGTVCQREEGLRLQ